MNSLFLAWAYLSHHRTKSLVLVVVTAAILAVPLAMQVVLAQSERMLTARAEATPLIVGARGSRLDLAMSAVYFTDDDPTPTTLAASEAIWDGGLATAIPVHTRFTAEGVRLVGVSLDYFGFRGLEVAEGRRLAMLGEAVVGANAAERLGLRPGGSLVSSPENLFDLAGVYPLKMPVVGVLSPTGGPDDDVAFIDIKTAWVIAGIGHGHDDLMTEGAEPGSSVAARPDFVQYQEITAENVDGFHFHGPPEAFPVTAVIVVPNDVRSATILKGRYLDAETDEQIIVPTEVIGGLLDRILKIKRLVDAVVMVFAMAALAAIGLAGYLSLQLRRSEIETAFKLGARKQFIARLVVAEAAIVLAVSATLAGAFILLVARHADTAERWLLAAAG